METREINGITFMIYPTIEHRVEVLDIFKDAQNIVLVEHFDEEGNVISTEKKNSNFDTKRTVKICSDIVWEACFNHSADGTQLEKKVEEKDTTYDDVKNSVIKSGVFELYVEIAMLLDIIDKSKQDEIKKRLSKVQQVPK